MWFFGLIAIALVTILILSLTSRAAAGGELEYLELENTSGFDIDTSYLLLSDADARVEARNYRLCDYSTFKKHADKVVDGARVDYDREIKDQDVAVVCFRADFGNGNYLYDYYPISIGAAGGSAIELAEQGPGFTDGDGVRKARLHSLLVLTGIPYPESDEETFPAAEYVPLTSMGQPCDAKAFAGKDKGEIFTVESGDQVDLSIFGLADYPGPDEKTPEHPSVALCFRVRVDEEYFYEKYGDVKSDIFFEISQPFGVGSEYGSYNDPGGDLIVHSPNAETLQYVYLEIGQACDFGAFAGKSKSEILDESTFPEDPNNSPTGLTIDASALALQAGVCFRADFGDGVLLYKGYDQPGKYINVRAVYKFGVYTQQYNEDLVVTSTRPVGSWRAIRSDSFQSYTKCDAEMFARHTADLSGVGKQTGEIVIGLDNDDAGRMYCVEVTEAAASSKKADKAYVQSAVIERPVPLQVTVTRTGNRLLASAFGGQKGSVSWQVFKQAGDYDEQCLYSGDHEELAYNSLPHNTVEVNLTAEDAGHRFCFRATKWYQSGAPIAVASTYVWRVEPASDSVAPVIGAGQVVDGRFQVSAVDAGSGLAELKWGQIEASGPNSVCTPESADGYDLDERTFSTTVEGSTLSIAIPEGGMEICVRAEDNAGNFSVRSFSFDRNPLPSPVTLPPTL